MKKEKNIVLLEKLGEFEKKFEELKGKLSFGRLGKTFKTEQNYYFYDTGTGKVATISENMYIVLNALFKNRKLTTLISNPVSEEELYKTAEEILFYVEKERILSANIPKTFVSNATEGLEEMLQDGMQSITLELTEKCNLRCRYCIYHPSHPEFREFGKRDMNIDTAKKAVDLLHQHSSNAETVYIGFYGGEPLINYKVIEEIIPYSKKMFSDKKIIFSLTTNGSLLTPKIAEYFAQEDVNIVFSLDGPRNIHNENRVYINGDGSFDATIKGIENLTRAYEKKGKLPNIGINIVTSPPNFEEKYTSIQKFLESCDWFGEHVSVTCSTVDYGAIEEEYRLPQSDKEEQRKSKMYNPLEKWSRENSKKGNGRELFSEATFAKGLLRVHRRVLTKEPVTDYYMNGCCVPGSRKAYITVDGNILPCERVGGIPLMGNVDDGFDFEEIRKNYIDDYINNSIPRCCECWAINMCSLCYIKFYDHGKVHPSYRNIDCIQERMYIEDDLVRYHAILETDPEYIDILDGMDLI